MPQRRVAEDVEELWGEVDPPAVGTDATVRFDGLVAGKQYRIHILLPSGESVFGKKTATKDGELAVSVGATSQALHVVEVLDNGAVVSRAHFTALSE